MLSNYYNTQHVFTDNQNKICCRPATETLMNAKNDTCLWNMDALQFDLSNSQGHVMSVKCELPLNELTVQVIYYVTI